MRFCYYVADLVVLGGTQSKLNYNVYLKEMKHLKQGIVA